MGEVESEENEGRRKTDKRCEKEGRSVEGRVEGGGEKGKKGGLLVNDREATEMYTGLFVGSVRCVEEAGWGEVKLQTGFRFDGGPPFPLSPILLFVPTRPY